MAMTFKDQYITRLIGGLIFALVALTTAPAAFAQSASAEGRAIALAPLSLVNVTDLEFGTMISGPAPGTATVNPFTGARSTTGGVTGASNDSSAARFVTYGGPLQFIFVTRGPLPVLTRDGGTETMNVSGLTLDGSTFRFLNAAGVVDLNVGGTLQVGADQEPGTYRGTFDITVTYF
ncbi:protein of unknown function [Parasphingorhabdus marina DSM 22363]|uniref:DUF4402 domain-containing protein n=1 Tax=Parasphingorhabdus marina DSM 22363 TaxID=1123272 RepID=A0A1N6H531_9SPHN|nr:DUF4402 domain-containing protein [Parasphingorhabdus marina]SIO14884.1 protein of unknown function [Parasphingorhabdus marina DSM 22363]